MQVPARFCTRWLSAGHKTQRDLNAGPGLRALLHRLDPLFHGLESCGEYGGGQLGYVLAIADSGFNPSRISRCCNSMNSAGLFTLASASIAAIKFLAFFVANS